MSSLSAFARSLLPASTLCLLAIACGDASPEIAGGSQDATANGQAPNGNNATPGGPAGANVPVTELPAGTGSCVSLDPCEGALPTVPKRPFKASPPWGAAQHRGRDVLYTPGATQTLIAKFAYGSFDDDLKHEEVDVFVQRSCAGEWEKLGTATTTTEEEHETFDGIDDRGGRVYFDVPKDKELPIGRHRIAMVVAGDGTSTDFIVDIVPKGTRLFVSDVDGTLSSSELAEFGAVATGTMADAHPDAAKVFNELAKKGYRPVFMTARPEWLIPRTREFLKAHGFPRGLVNTPTALVPVTGEAASTFKSNAVKVYTKYGVDVPLSFGNTDSDAAGFKTGGVPDRVFFQFTDATHGGRRIEAYKEFLPEVEKLAPACK